MKTALLTGAALRYAVSIALGYKVSSEGQDSYKVADENGLIGFITGCNPRQTYAYSPDLIFGYGETRIKERLTFLDAVDQPEEGKEYMAVTQSGSVAYGPSEPVAACRAIVVEKFGDTVQVPEDIINK